MRVSCCDRLNKQSLTSIHPACNPVSVPLTEIEETLEQNIECNPHFISRHVVERITVLSETKGWCKGWMVQLKDTRTVPGK